jgi:diacylglycerol kinase (ATP)
LHCYFPKTEGHSLPSILRYMFSPLQQNTSFLPPERDRVLLSLNPKAGPRAADSRVERLAELLRKEGLWAEIQTDLDEAAGRANQWHTEGRLRALVGVGGDGTAAELANRTPPGLPLTMLPSGNENLLARHLSLGETAENVCRTITDGTLLRLDAGRANGRIFLLMASCGFDADVVQRVHAHRSGHIRNRDYLKPILKSIRNYEYPELRINWDDQDTGSGEVRSPPPTARWLFAFNLPCYGGGFRIAPRADGNDGLLDVCTFRRGSLWHGLRYAGAVLLGRHQGLADCATRRVRRLRVTSEAKVPYQLDGDPGGWLPLDIQVLSGRLTMVVSKSEVQRRQQGVAP